MLQAGSRDAQEPVTKGQALALSAAFLGGLLMSDLDPHLDLLYFRGI